MYNYWKRTPVKFPKRISKARRALQEKNLDFLDFVKFVLSHEDSYFYNVQPEQFQFTGLTEEYSKSLSILKKKYLPELKIPKEQMALNTNPDKSTDQSYQHPEMAELKQLLANEISIYHRAKSKFESDYDSISRLRLNHHRGKQ